MTIQANAGLSALPAATRQRGALGLGAAAALVALVGALCLVAGHVVLVVIGVVALLTAVVAGLAAWGLWHSVRLDAVSTDLDEVVVKALAAHPGAFQCDCGHEHDPTELHVTDAEGPERAADCTAGAGAACTHDCATCLFQRGTGSPAVTVDEPDLASNP